MIVTVTMNPAIDKTAYIEKFEHGGLNRIKNVFSDAGGKGINVSKTIHELGGNTVATGFLGGSSGIIIEKVLKENNIKSDFIKIKNEIRTNLKVVEENGFVTELNEPGPVISEDELNQLLNKLENYADKNTLFILAGSIPNGINKNIYKTIIEKVKSKGSKVFLDADGELFINSLDAKPDIIKPNRTELEQYFKIDYRTNEQELIDMGNKLLEKGISMVNISLGQMGALFITNDYKIKCPGLSVKAYSTVGAGDAMVAALSYGIDNNLDYKECIKLGMATSADAVTTKGTNPPKKELVDQLIKQVEIIEI